MNIEELFRNAFDDEHLQDRFYYEFLSNDIYVLGNAQFNDGVLEEGSELHLVSLRSDGEVFIPIFLSVDSLEYFLEGNDQEYIMARGSDLLETLKKSNIMINPGQEITMVLYADEIQHILTQAMS